MGCTSALRHFVPRRRKCAFSPEKHLDEITSHEREKSTGALRSLLSFLHGVYLNKKTRRKEKKSSCSPGWIVATILHSSPIKWDQNPPPVEFSTDKLVSDNHFYSEDTSFFNVSLYPSPTQPGIGPNLPTVSHGTAGRLRGLGGICAFPSVAHSLLSKPLPLSAAICSQPYPTGRKHEHFHRIWTVHKLKRGVDTNTHTDNCKHTVEARNAYFFHHLSVFHDYCLRYRRNKWNVVLVNL